MIEQDWSWPGPDMEPDPDWCMLIDDSPEGPEEYWENDGTSWGSTNSDPLSDLRDAFIKMGRSYGYSMDHKSALGDHYHHSHHHPFVSLEPAITTVHEAAQRIRDAFLSEEKERRKEELAARKEEEQKHPRNGPRKGPQFKGGKRQW